jgi:putative MFS transporter
MRARARTPRSPAVAGTGLFGWLHATVVAVTLLAVASGFGQYAVTASLADVAVAFGADEGAATTAAQTGLSLTVVGVGLAVIRLASLAALPLSSLADRVGRRRVLLTCVAVGLALTALAAASPSFWWFVAIIALARPLFSATNAVGLVVAGEETTSAHRTKAVALAAAGYGIGVGLVSIARVPVNSLLGLGFGGLFVLAVVPLLALPLIARLLHEPDRFVRLRTTADTPRLRALTAMHPAFRGRLALTVGAQFALNLVIGPGNTFVFLYAEGGLGISRATMALAVVVAGVLGLVGLLLGRWLADRIGRRAVSLAAHATIAVAGVVTYSGSGVWLFAGWWLSVLAQGAYGPAFGALSTEVFPTSNRATAQGWLAAAGVLGAVAGLVLFGRISDLSGSFLVGALAVGVPCVMAVLAYTFLPETRGQELEQSAPEPA